MTDVGRRADAGRGGSPEGCVGKGGPLPCRACCSLFQAAWDMCQTPEKKRTGAGAGWEWAERASTGFAAEGRGDCGGDGGGDGGGRPWEARVWA